MDITNLNKSFRYILLSYEPVSFSLKLSLLCRGMKPSIGLAFLCVWYSYKGNRNSWMAQLNPLPLLEIHILHLEMKTWDIKANTVFRLFIDIVQVMRPKIRSILTLRPTELALSLMRPPPQASSPAFSPFYKWSKWGFQTFSRLYSTWGDSNPGCQPPQDGLSAPVSSYMMKIKSRG